MASRAAKSKPSREIRDLKKQLEDLAAGVLSGEVDRGKGAVVNQILNTRLRAIELERRVKTTDELAEEIRQLKERLDRDGQRKAR